MPHRIDRHGAWWRGVVAALVAGVAGMGCARVPGPVVNSPPELWFYQGANLAEPGVVARLRPVWERAAQAGYRRVVLADEKFGRLAEMEPAFFEHAASLRALADSLGLGIIPGVFQVGRSGAMLAEDPNLVEALPVEGVLMEVHGGRARVVSEPPVAIPAASVRRVTGGRP